MSSRWGDPHTHITSSTLQPHLDSSHTRTNNLPTPLSKLIRIQLQSTIHNNMSSQTQQPKVLFVLTSHDKMGNTGKPTGWYLVRPPSPFHKIPSASISLSLSITTQLTFLLLSSPSLLTLMTFSLLMPK